MRRCLFVPIFACTISVAARGQTRPALAPADYGKWETPGAAALSPDGRWLADTVARIHEPVESDNFARRAGKEDFVILVYPGEDHGLRQKQNQVDYHRRIQQWFGHWLKGEPAPQWVTQGVAWQRPAVTQP